MEQEDIFEMECIYGAKYTILEYSIAGPYNDFDRTIHVLVLPADKIKEYDKLDMMVPDDEEKQLDMLNLLIFKAYPGKMQWLRKKDELCDEKKYWEIDLDNDFIPIPCITIKNKVTGTRYRIPTYKVKLVKDNLDIIEAFENGEFD